MRYLPLLALLFTACATPAPSVDKATGATDFLVGTYDDPGVHEPGIYRFALNTDGSLTNRGRVVEATNPSFLAYNDDRSVVVSVEQLDKEPGRVAAFAVLGEELQPLNRQTSGSEGPCHVNVSQDGYVTVANYNGGTLELLKLEADGALSAPLDLQNHHRNGAEEPHAHSSYFLQKGREVLAVDLGTDQVWHYSLDEQDGKLVPTNPETVNMEAGAGPRHLTIHPSGKWIYVINELNSTVTRIDRSKDGLTAAESYSTLPDDFTGESYCADIHVSSDGKFLYGSNRGHNSIVVYGIDQRSGALTPLEYESVAGDWPRNFALSPDEQFLLVANQRSKNITTLRRNEKTGMLDFVTSTTAPIPVCILF